MKTIIDYIEQHAKEKPQKICIIDENGEYSYEQYFCLIKRFSIALKQSGITKSENVLIIASQSILYTACFHAIQYIGAVPVPLERNVKPDRIKSIAETTLAHCIISDSEIDGINTITYDYINSVKSSSEIKPDYTDIANILFTTGTTGKSKGVVISHKADLAVAENVIFGTEKSVNEVEIIPMPLNHAFGLRRYFANTVLGATSIFLNGVINLKAFFNAFTVCGATAVALNPSAIEIIFKLSRNKISEFASQISYVQLGSAHLSNELKQKLKEALPSSRLYNFYGSTEAGCSCISNFANVEEPENCIGKPTVHSRFKVIDNNGEEIASSAENKGRLICSGEMCMECYYRDEELTAEIYKNGYVYSNDLSYIDSNGYIYLFGRADDVITCGGNKISPEEVEDCAKLSGLISDCACVPFFDKTTNNTVVKLFVVPAQKYCEAELSKFLSKELEYYMVPKKFEEISEIPKTFNGKPLRRKLTEGVILK